MAVVSSFEYHSKNPNISIREHIKSKQLELGQYLAKKSMVYLDTRYWILLRNVELQVNQKPSVNLLYDLLKKCVKEGFVICPLSDAIYQEVLKQSDLKTREATAKLIDNFSDGISLVTEDERFAQEFADAIYRLANSHIDVYDLSELVWTKASFALGRMLPELSGFPVDVKLTMEKVFIDEIWNTPFSDMISRLPAREEPDIYKGVSDVLNRGKQKHADDHGSLKQVFIAEIQGILDVKKNLISDVLIQQFESQTGQKVKQEDIKPSNMFPNLIREAIKRNKMQDFLPSLHIGAWLHAAVRWDKGRKFSDNDFLDFHHAIAALPYCDFFLTERSLCSLLNQSNLELAENYSCKVLSSVDEAISCLEGILDI